VESIETRSQLRWLVVTIRQLRLRLNERLVIADRGWDMLLSMPDPLAPKPVDLCLVADAVLREAKTGRLPQEFTPHATACAMAFLLRMGLGPELNQMVQKAKDLKGGGPP